MLSEYLLLNGGIEIKKACKIKKHTWEAMMRNERPPTITTFDNIVKYLSRNNPNNEHLYKKTLFRAIMASNKQTRSMDVIAHIEPKAAPRPRYSSRGKYGGIYNPSTYTAWKRRFAQVVGNLGVISGPCRIKVQYFWKTGKTNQFGPHTNNKDIDNLDKAFLDGLQLNGLLENDKNVYDMHSQKFYGYESKIHFQIYFNHIWTNKNGVV